MMLGILFATSKQYSDKLAVDEARGITGAIHEGKYVGLVKKGYYADTDTGRFMPDGVHWQLLCQAIDYCRNKECIRHNDEEAIRVYGKKLPRSISARFVTAHIEWTMRHMTANVLEAHKQYIDRIEKQVAIDKDIAKRKLSEAKAELIRQKDMYSKYQNFQVEDPETYKKHRIARSCRAYVLVTILSLL